MKKGVSIILVNPKKELLLQLRDNKPNIYFPGYWGTIGGGIKKKESPIDAIKREIKEEINCRVSDITFIGKMVSKNMEILYYLGKIKKDIKNINLSEGQEVKYFKLKEIKNLHLVPLSKKMIFKNKDKII